MRLNRAATSGAQTAAHALAPVSSVSMQYAPVGQAKSVTQAPPSATFPAMGWVRASCPTTRC